MDKDLAAPFVVSLAFEHIRTAVVEHAAPGHALNYDFPMSRAAIR